MANVNQTELFRVFGLERSGTNLLEWVVKKHFNPNYERIMIIAKDPLMRKFGKWQSLKHTTPNLDHSIKGIVIYKPFIEWENSWMNFYLRGDQFVLDGQKGCTKAVYNNYLKAARDQKMLMIKYKSLTDNYTSTIKRIAKYLGKPVPQIIHPLPTKWMGTNMDPRD